MSDQRDVSKRILVIANETAEEQELHEVIRSCSRGARAEVLVIAPALNSRLRHWFSDEDQVRLAAESRLEICLERLSAAGIRAHGQVGDADPVEAISDGLHGFAADEIVLATQAGKRSHRSSRDLVERVRKRFAGPIFHVAIDAVHRRERHPAPQPVSLIPRLSERR